MGSSENGAASGEDRAVTSRSVVPQALPWYRQPGYLVVLVALVAVAVVATAFAIGRNGASSDAGSPDKTLATYFSENGITTKSVLRGNPDAPNITLRLPEGWSDAGPDTPEGAYAAAFYDTSLDPEYPPSVVVLLSKVTGNADPEQILHYSTGELLTLPDYVPVTEPTESVFSGFDAVQLGGFYTREDGDERIIAQKTVVIPEEDGLYLLQFNADAPREEAPVLQVATGYLDEYAKITP